MATDSPVKALLIAITDDAPAAVYAVNRLNPELLCIFAPESAKNLVESSVQPKIAKMPRKWDWIVTSDVTKFMVCYQAVARSLPDMMRTWDVQAGELVVDLTGATPAMAAALSLASLPFTSRMVTIGPAVAGSDGEAISIEGRANIWLQGNPWDEAAAQARHEACEYFNRGSFAAASVLFRQIEARVSGGQKPMYRAFSDIAEGYGLWERFQYRQAWDKLKTAHKALEMASVWGGPPGLKTVLTGVKQNAGFLEKLVLDPNEVKETLALDLLAHARRRAEIEHDHEAAMITLVRALAGLGSQMGQTYLAQWPKMKPLLDAANQAVLGHGFETIKPERFQQLHEIVVKLTGVGDTSLPKFPTLNL